MSAQAPTRIDYRKSRSTRLLESNLVLANAMAAASKRTAAELLGL
jgi:hypothetical protein